MGWGKNPQMFALDRSLHGGTVPWDKKMTSREEIITNLFSDELNLK